MSSKKNKSNIEYYMGLPYTVHIEEQKDEDGHFYYAYISELGKYTCYGVGKSIEKALKSLEVAKEVTIGDILEAGKTVPLPKEEEEILPSGKFVVRMSPRLHARLIMQAKKEGISLNLLVNELLSQNLTLREIGELLKSKGTNRDEAKRDVLDIQKRPITIDQSIIEKANFKRRIIHRKENPFMGIKRGLKYKKVS